MHLADSIPFQALNNSAHKRDDDPNYFGYDGTKYFPDFVTGYRTICGGAKNCEGGKDEDIACLVDCGLRRCKAQLGYDGKDWTDQNTNWCKWLYWHNYPRRDESVQTCGPFSLGPCPLENPILQRDDKDKDKPKDEDGFPIDDDDFIKDPKEEYNALCGLFGIGKCRLDTFVDPVCVKDCAKDLCVDWKLEIYNPGYPSHLDERKCRWLDYHDWPMESISDQAHENSKQKRDDKDEDKDDDTPMYVDAEEVCSEICGYIPGECDVGLDRDIGCLARCASKRCEDRRGYYGEDWNDEDEKKCKWLRHQPLWSPPGHE